MPHSARRMQAALAVVILTSTMLVGTTFCQNPLTITEEFITSVNAKAKTWTAENNDFLNYTIEQLKAFTGLTEIGSPPNGTLPIVRHIVRKDKIPNTFDSRKTWPFCESLRTIRNQGMCGSCWAFAAVEVMSDRLCIFSGGKKKFTFSPEELVSCCTGSCYGCKGGTLGSAFIYWKSNGIPSGGDYNSNYGCRPYTAEKTGATPACNKRCVPKYGKQWKDDIRHGISAFEVAHTVEQMQHEIVTHGPVSVAIHVYQDFFSYKTGVYQHTKGKLVGYHGVKLIGWGTEKGSPYWLLANSWGSGWGEGGFFKVLRGSNHCAIESSVFAGNPKMSE